MQGVSHAVSTGADVDRSAAQARHMIDRCLKDPMVVAAQVAFGDADVDFGLPCGTTRRGRVAGCGPEGRKCGDDCQET
jgi:hypothetical protein